MWTQDAFAVYHDAFAGIHSPTEDKPGAGYVGGATAYECDANIFLLFSNQFQGIHQTGQGYGGRALLIVVPNRYLSPFTERIQYTETFGLGDILQIDAA